MTIVGGVVLALAAEVVVTSVVGLHQGTCGPRRVAEVQRAITTLTAAELAPANRCRCTYATHRQILTSEKIRNRDVRKAAQLNVITITLAAPIMLPDEKSNALKTPTVELVAEGLPGDRLTILLLGHEPERVYHDVMFGAYMFKGDPFHLATAPGRECGS